MPLNFTKCEKKNYLQYKIFSMHKLNEWLEKIDTKKSV